MTTTYERNHRRKHKMLKEYIITYGWATAAGLMLGLAAAGIIKSFQ